MNDQVFKFSNSSIAERFMIELETKYSLCCEYVSDTEIVVYNVPDDIAYKLHEEWG